MRPNALAVIGAWLGLNAACGAAGLPVFGSDPEADVWLRENSRSYRRMAEAVDRQGGYTIRPGTEWPGGLAYFKDGRGYLELNDALEGGHRVSVLIFELTNLYQEQRHQEVADRVRRGELDQPAVFALWREMIEYDGLRMHRGVLAELEPKIGGIPPEMIAWATTATSFADYELPLAYDYLKAQGANGHTAYFLRLFEKHRAEYLNGPGREGAAAPSP
jgi:hypothetical protein